ncbi:MAG: hypothetical protein V9G98_21370 [Candidatus Competibacter sp.]
MRRWRPGWRPVGVQVNIDTHTRAGVMVRILKREPPAPTRDDCDGCEGGFEKNSSGKKKVDCESLSADAAILWEELRTVKGFAEELWFSQKLAWAIDRVRDAANELKQLGFATVAGPLIGPVKRQAA